MKINMTDTYRYENGGTARVLCVDAPGRKPVLTIEGTGVINHHSLDGVSKRVGRSLIKVGEWDHIPIDAKVIVRLDWTCAWQKRHFAGINVNGYPMAWVNGQTSWSTSCMAQVWNCCEVAKDE